MMKSSYSQNNYGDLIEAIVKVNQPEKIIEFGILEGYEITIFKTFPSMTMIYKVDF